MSLLPALRAQVEVTDNYKHCSLIEFRNNHNRKKFYDRRLRAFLKQSCRNAQLLEKKIQGAYSLNLFKGRIFSHERPFYGQAVSNLVT
jgi:hypothetical protein